MWRFLKIAVPVFVVGFIAGNAFWYMASPLWIDVVVSETLPDELNLTVTASGNFAGPDPFHDGGGVAKILMTPSGAGFVSLSDLHVTNGPDLKVILVKAANPKKSADVKAVEWISLGPLKGNIGNQTYSIPSDLDPSEYGSVAIWCERFGALFASAPLKGS